MPLLVLTLRQIVVLGVLAAVAWSAGRLVLPRVWRRDAAAAAMPWPLTMAVGLALLCQAAFLLGLIGALRAPVVEALAIGLVAARAGQWRLAMRRGARAEDDGDRAVLPASQDRHPETSTGGETSIGETPASKALIRKTPIREALVRAVALLAAPIAKAPLRVETRAAAIAIVVIVMLVAGIPFLLTLYPPLGFDQSMYHLPYARAFAASGSLPFLPALRYPVFPALAEVLNAAVLLFADGVATQTVGWLALITSAGLAYAWARELSSAAGGWLAAGALIGNPIAVYLAATGYVEPMLGLFTLAALYAAYRARLADGRQTPAPAPARVPAPAPVLAPAPLAAAVSPDLSRETGATAGWRDDNRLAWMAIAGALAGSAAGVKYLGLFTLPACLLLSVRWRASFAKNDAAAASMRATWFALACYALAAGLALAPVYVRLIALTGNPLFPFYPDLFGSSAWDAQEYLGRRGIARLLAASTFLWDITFNRHAVGGLPFWSPAIVCGAPLAIWAAWTQPAWRWLLVIAVGYVMTAPVNAHYFLGIAPLWCVLIGAGAANIAGLSLRGQRRLCAIALVIASGGAAYTGYRLHRLGPPPATAEARAALLSAQLPLYPAVAFLNRTAGRSIVYGVDAQRMVLYFDGTLLGDFHGPASYARVTARAQRLDSLAAAIEETGAAYLLIPSASSISPASSSPSLPTIPSTLAIPPAPVIAATPSIASAASWHERATQDPRLSLLYHDDAACVFRVMPAQRRENAGAR